MNAYIYHVTPREYISSEHHACAGYDLRIIHDCESILAPGEWPCARTQLVDAIERGILASLEALEHDTWPNG
jgi:hypothetical protein